MKKIWPIIRGVIMGCVIWGIASVTSAVLANYFFPFRMDSYYIPGVGGFSPSSARHDQAMYQFFLFSVIVYTIIFTAMYLYMRRQYYKKHPIS